MNIFNKLVSSDKKEVGGKDGDTAATTDSAHRTVNSETRSSDGKSTTTASKKRLSDDKVSSKVTAKRPEAPCTEADTAPSTVAVTDTSVTSTPAEVTVSSPSEADGSKVFGSGPGGKTSAVPPDDVKESADDDQAEEGDDTSKPVDPNAADKARDGELRLASQQLSSVLKTRTREELEAENRKLRIDLATMRRRLNAAQDNLSLTRETVNKYIANAPAELCTAWQETETRITADQEALEKDIAATSGAEIANGARLPRRNRRQHWKERPRRKTGGQEVAVAGVQQGKQSSSGTMASEDGARPQDFSGGGRFPRRAHQMPAMGAPGAATKKRNRRSGERMTNARNVPPISRQQTAAQMAYAEQIRDEMRAAASTEDFEAAIAKAKSCGMKHEIKIATKKMKKLNAGKATNTTDAARKGSVSNVSTEEGTTATSGASAATAVNSAAATDTSAAASASSAATTKTSAATSVGTAADSKTNAGGHSATPAVETVPTASN